jgi:hypothetical protein
MLLAAATKLRSILRVQRKDRNVIELLALHRSNRNIALPCPRVIYEESHANMEDEDVFRNWLDAQVRHHAENNVGQRCSAEEIPHIQ